MTKYTLPDYDTAMKFVDGVVKMGFSTSGGVSLAAPELFRKPGPIVVETTAPSWAACKVRDAIGTSFLPNKKPWEK